ncbi:MAG: protein translocase subunit SecF [Dehalococcoidia bacterium]|jgi:preprotein translocase subunit SecF
MFNVTGKRTLFLIISEVLILICIIALVVLGLTPGVEFSSGSILTVSFDEEVEQAELETAMTDLGYSNVIIQRTGGGDFIIRTQEISGEERMALEDSLSAEFGTLTEREFYSVSPMVAAETANNAMIAVGVAAVGILLYITWAFRKMPKPFHYGVCAIIALVHDVVIVLGLFAIFGAIMNWEINLMFITGVLAVIGYSINNTVVVFDRIRENLRRGISANFETVVNNSLVETLSRSMNTSLTTMIVVLALLLFVGSTILNFAIVLLIGIIAGTYSSLFIAPNLLLVWDRGEWGRLILLPQTKAKEA